MPDRLPRTEAMGPWGELQLYYVDAAGRHWRVYDVGFDANGRARPRRFGASHRLFRAQDDTKRWYAFRPGDVPHRDVDTLTAHFAASTTERPSA